MRSRFFRSESGTSLIEFALVAPVMIFLLIGIVEIGRYAFFSILAANAARAGVQYGAQSLATAQDTNGIKTAALNDGQRLTQWTATPQYLCATSGGALQSCAAGSTPSSTNTYYVKVTVTGQFKTLLSYPGIPNNVNVSGSSLMRVISQ